MSRFTALACSSCRRFAPLARVDGTGAPGEWMRDGSYLTPIFAGQHAKPGCEVRIVPYDEALAAGFEELIE